MNWSQRGPLLAGALVAVLALLWLSLFTVSENEFAVRSSLGKMQPETYAPGLHWCWPFESIARVERRVIGQRMQGESFLTAEQQALVLDIDLSWRVRDAATFLRASAGEEKLAAGRLADTVRGELKAAYAQQPLVRIIAAPRGGLSAAVMARLNAVAAGLGLELLDARVQRIDPTDELANALYANMQAAYGAQARQVRAEGRGMPSASARRPSAIVPRSWPAPIGTRSAFAVKAMRRPPGSTRAPTGAIRSSRRSTGACRLTARRWAAKGTSW